MEENTENAVKKFDMGVKNDMDCARETYKLIFFPSGKKKFIVCFSGSNCIVSCQFTSDIVNCHFNLAASCCHFVSSPVGSLCHTPGVVRRPSSVVRRVSSVSTITTRNN